MSMAVSSAQYFEAQVVCSGFREPMQEPNVLRRHPMPNQGVSSLLRDSKDQPKLAGECLAEARGEHVANSPDQRQ